MKKLIIYIIISFVFIGKIISQDPVTNDVGLYDTGDVLPVAPNTAAITKYADEPVNLATGTVNIPISLCAVQSKDLSVPISVSYHTGGIKTHQEASNVGLGWSLQAGGAITRSINGKIDELGGIGYWDIDFDPSNPQDLVDATQTGWDTEPDLFSFNFGGHSGKFIRLSSGDVKFYSDSKIKMEYAEGNWIATDLAGIIYYFTDKEYSENTSYGFVADNVVGGVTGWYLSRMESPSGSIITFDYDEITTLYNVNANSTSKTIKTGYRGGTHCASQGGIQCFGGQGEEINYSFGASSIGQKLITKISGEYNNVVFKYSNQREDNEGRFLEKIELVNKSIQIIKTYDFDYTYFSSPSYDDPYIGLRLKLDSITETGEGEAYPPYIFTYFNEDKLANKYSQSFDHWGFQNNFNGTALQALPYPATTEDLLNYGNANRKSDINCLNGMISSIKYPTGLMRNFDFEITEEPVEQEYIETKTLSLSCMDNCETSGAMIINELSLSNITIDFEGSCDQECIAELKIYDTNTNQLVFSNLLQGFNSPLYMTLPASNYKVILTTYNGENATAVISYETLETEVETQIIGGPRIKSISDQDGTRQFIYNPNETESGMTKLINTPFYSANTVVGYEQQCGNNIGFIVCHYCNAKMYSSNSLSSSISGSHIFYPEVREMAKDQSFIDYKFEYYADTPTPHFLPLVPANSYEVLRGQTDEIKYYNTDGALVKIEDFNYDTSINNLETAYKISNPVTNCFDDIQQEQYNHRSILKQLVNKSTITYGFAGSAVSVNETYTYNSNFLTEFTTVTDGSTTKIYENKYSDAQFMVDAHMLGVKVETVVNGGQGGGSRLEFTEVGSNIVPSKSYSLQDDNTWKLMAELLYDDGDAYIDIINQRGKAVNLKLEWDQTLNKRGLLQYLFHGDRTTSFLYDSKRLQKGVTNYDGISSTYDYDGLYRLDLQTSNNGKITNTHIYNYGLASGGENTISSTISFDNGPGYSTNTIFDAFGRSVSNTMMNYLDGGGDLILSTTYDPMGRAITNTDPRSGGTTSSIYENSALSRLKSTTPAGSSKEITQTHLCEDNQFVVVTTDENGNETKTYTDIFGRTTKTIDALGGETSYTYNDRDQVLTIQPPLGEPYIYTYYPDGLLHTKTIPDKGTHTYVYNQYDQIDTETLPNGKTLTYIYDATYNDFLRQILLDGETIKTIEPYDDIVKGWVGSEETAIFGPTGSMVGTHKVTYSDFDPDFGRPQFETITTLEGTVTNELTYDDAGNLINQISNINGPGLSVIVDGGDDTFLPDNRMKTKAESINGFNTSYTLDYNGNDWLTKKDLGIQTIDYQYNPRGWLTHINSVTDATDENPDPCIEPELPTPPGFDIDCDTLLDIITTVLIKYDCIKYNEDGGNIEIEFTRQYFDGGQRVGVESQTFSTLEGGNDGDFEQQITFTLGEDANNNTFGAGIIDILLDCIENNPNFLTDINELLNQINGGPNGGGNSSGGGDDDGDVEFTPTNNKEDVFGMQLHYFDGNPELSADPQYNGNISWMEWNVKGEKRQAYGFGYDANNRLLNAQHGLQSNINICEYDESDQYTVSGIGYDALGNIQSIQRKGLLDPDAEIPEYVNIDALSYAYNGTSLLSGVTDGGEPERGFKNGASSYGYDGTGNLISDSGKGISNIIYTYNDLPLHIQTDKGVIKNYYTADGLKVKSVVISSEEGPDGMNTAPKTTNYIGQAEYENGRLKAVYHDEGRIVYEEQGAPYREFFMKDHLGNTRVRIADKNNDSNVEIDYNDPENDELMDGIHYYPFGMQWDTPNKDLNGNSLEPTGSKTKYTYNGKEFQDDLGVNLHYYGFRVYDPAIGRFTSVDPIAEKFAHVSGFNYAENKPINGIDLHGLQYVGFGSAIQNAHIRDTKGNAAADQHIKETSTVTGQAMVAATAVGAAVVAAPTILGAMVSLATKGATAIAGSLTLETSIATVAVNVTADAAIQTVGNLAEGKDPVENFDVAGSVTSAIASPVASNFLDGFVDITQADGVQFNSTKDAVVNTAIGGGVGKSLSSTLSDIKKHGGELIGQAATFLTNLFTNASKEAATNIDTNE